MAEDRTFTLVGRFDDHITPALVKINSGLDKLKTSLKKSSNDLAKVTKSFKDVGNAAKSAAGSFSRFNNSATRSLRGLQREVAQTRATMFALSRSLDFRGGRTSARALRGDIADLNRELQTAARSMRGLRAPTTRGGRRTPPGGGGGGGGGGGPVEGGGFYRGRNLTGDVFRGSLLANAASWAAQEVIGLVQGAFSKLGRYFNEAIEDELSDIAQAGAIFSMGGRFNVPWADTMEEALKVQRQMDMEMSKLAATLPGNTQDYVRNAKMLSDTVFMMYADETKAFTSAMQQYARDEGDFDRFFKDAKGNQLGKLGSEQAAFQYGTKELAKFATLTDMLNPTEGIPFNVLFEQMLNTPDISLPELKRRYNAIKRNPLLSGALEEHIDEINSTEARSLDRMMLFLRIFQKMYPPEVIEAFERSVNGVTENIKTYIGSLEAGIFGLKRSIKIVKKGVTYEETLYNVLRDIYAGIGNIVAPILQYLPNLWDPMRILMESLGDIWFASRESVKVFAKAQEKFRNMGFGDAEKNIRAAISSILFLTRWAGGDLAAIANIEKTLGSKDLDVGKAIKESLGLLFQSKFADDFGYALGKGIGTIFKDIVKLLNSDLLSDASQGLVGGFVRGFTDSKGLAAINELLGMAIKTIFNIAKTVFIAAMSKAPVETTILTGIITGVIPVFISRTIYGLVLRSLQWVGARMLAASLIAAACNPITPALYSLARGLGLKISAMLAGILPALQATATGAAALTQTVVGGFLGFLKGLGAIIGTALTRVLAFLAPLTNPVTIAAAIVVAVGALVYVFKDQIRAALEAVSNWIKAHFQGPLKDALLGVTKVWKGIVNTIVGSIDWLIGLVTGDKERMEQGGRAVSEGVRQFFSGWKQILSNAIGAMVQAGQMWVSWATKEIGNAAKALFTAIANGIKGAISGLDALQGNFMSTIGRALMGLANRVFSWLTGIPMPGQPQATPDGKQAPNQKPNSTLPVPAPVNHGIDFFNWVKDKVNPPPSATPQYNGMGVSMPLLSAIKSETLNKPAGSGLVIANTSETVIPAAGGYGMEDLFKTFELGFSSLAAVYKDYARKQESMLATINNTLRSNQQQTNATLVAIQQKFSTPSIPGGLGGGQAGGVDAFTGMAQRYGLQLTSGYRPGDPGWHGANRARDFSNGTGPTPQMLAFAQALAANYGSNLKELIYTPLGFSIKNGQKVPPYAQGSHYNHVHVAYGLGVGSPAFFGSQSEAVRWERAMAPRDARIASVTSNSSEMGGSTTNVHLGGVTVNADGLTDPNQIAYIVAQKIGQAVRDAESGALTLNYY